LKALKRGLSPFSDQKNIIFILNKQNSKFRAVDPKFEKCPENADE
jgi:hypothetical protein